MYVGIIHYFVVVILSGGLEVFGVGVCDSGCVFCWVISSVYTYNIEKANITKNAIRYDPLSTNTTEEGR